MKEEIIAFLSKRKGATICGLFDNFTLHSRDRCTTRRFVDEALNELVAEGRVKLEIDSKIGWIYSLPEGGA